ncbi:MAG: 50S ribosomal protein L23 [Candidatus Moranbacteria bacterium GW2011_GWE1_36_7]|nr:MAG: 50S ribosomal protein L23 [Candidatus Moranbacteria bacterium GW2011_GWD2_36_12]KKQ06276.1 MAG: 50S ribosomal protein L23 [Candidatus Moranbacteria bacterium GW2011_GWE2_36_40]KKQ13891.1 MAG: 50S ribosomal protein L23 [Candidatus Moranbacteria bacterium GW2011_GWE1_36_7]
MALIEEKKEIVVDSKDVVKKKVKKSSDDNKNVVAAPHAGIAYKVLIEPWITEKTHKAIADNKYTFKVIADATKKLVKLAIEGMYNVKVEKITVVNIQSKKKAYGRHMGKKAGFKKATVTLKKGDKIELFQGV